MSEPWRRLRVLFRRKRFDRELEEEMRSHLEALAEENQASGMEAEEARHAARRQFGNVTFLQEVSWQMWGWTWLETWLQDLRYTLRTLRRNPGFTAVAVVTLALGVGANTAVFGLMDALLWKMLPVRAPEELVFIQQVTRRETYSRFSYPVFAALRSNARTLADVFAMVTPHSVLVRPEGAPQAEGATAQLVSGNFFAALGVGPRAGRVLTVEDDRVAGGHPVTVISHAYWKRRLAQDPSAVGRTLIVNNAPLTVVGVAPPEFFGVSPGSPVEIWIPAAMQSAIRYNQNVYSVGDLRDRERPWLNQPHIFWLQLMARLKPGVKTTAAAAELDALNRQSLEHYGARGQRLEERIALTPGARGLQELRRRFSEPLWTMFGMVVLVLLIACANVANLLLARAAARRREMAVRLATGAARGRLIRQLLTESVLLAALGAALGVLLAQWGRVFFVALIGGAGVLQLPAWLDIRVLAFTASVAFLTAILFGTAPALEATRVDLTAGLKEAGPGVGPGRLRLGKALVVGQVALSMFLLFGAALLVRSLRNLQNVELGFRRDNLLLVQIQPRLLEYRPAQLADLFERLLRRVELIPGVQSASVSERPLVGGGTRTSNFSIAGYQPRPGEELNVRHMAVTQRYFETVGMTLVEGRLFNSGDTRDSPRVAVINESMARRYFSGRPALGARFVFGAPFRPPGLEVIGVARDFRHGDLKELPAPMAFVLASQNLGRLDAHMLDILQSLDLEVHTAAGSWRAVAAELRRVIAEVEPRLPTPSVRTMEEQIDRSLARERAVARLAALFGGLAVALAAIGLFGLLSYTVARRTREIGIRVAVGASQTGLLWLILREAIGLAAAGTALGLLAAAPAGRLIASQLYGLTPTDPPTIALATLVLSAIAALAGYLPARRASRIDPMAALRHE